MKQDQAKPLLAQEVFVESVVGAGAGGFQVVGEEAHGILQAATISTSHSGAGSESDSAVFNTFRFFQEFKRIYLISFNLHTEKMHLLRTVELIGHKINKIQSNLEVQEQQTGQIKVLDQRREKNSEDTVYKRLRRTEQIYKRYSCQVVSCKKRYGSEGSLKLHIKLKHPQLGRALKAEVSELGSAYDGDNDHSSI